MNLTLANNNVVTIRLLEKDDACSLLNYFSGLSAETKSRFGPHPFDRQTVYDICNSLPGDTRRYIAKDEKDLIVAYMLIKNGMIEEDKLRLSSKNINYDIKITCTFAPSVADHCQNSGLGSNMYEFIEKDIYQNTDFRFIVLWGGVQALNSRAVHFYEKKGFQHLGSFWHNEKDNYDMVKHLSEL